MGQRELLVMSGCLRDLVSVCVCVCGGGGGAAVGCNTYLCVVCVFVVVQCHSIPVFSNVIHD